MSDERKERSPVDIWAGFLAFDKLTPERCGENVMRVVALCERLAAVQPQPKFFRSYQDRTEARRLVCETAIIMGLALTSIKHRGKVAMGRGLLDVWRAVYAERFGSDVGTAGDKEARRRNARMLHNNIFPNLPHQPLEEKGE